jgi:excisionase family DNA binding protein
MEDVWITTNDAAQLTGYQPAHIRLLIRNQEIEGQKWGRDWMVSKESLLAYIDKQQSQGKKRGPKTGKLN